MPDWDKHIESSCYSRSVAKLECENRHKWDAGGFFEYGGWFFDDDDEAMCTECGKEGEIQP